MRESFTKDCRTGRTNSFDGSGRTNPFRSGKPSATGSNENALIHLKDENAAEDRLPVYIIAVPFQGNPRASGHTVVFAKSACVLIRILTYWDCSHRYMSEFRPALVRVFLFHTVSFFVDNSAAVRTPNLTM